MPEFDPHTVTALRREFIQAIRDEKLILIPAEYGDLVFNTVKKQQDLLSQKAITAFKVARYNLIPNCTTIRTLKNMVVDGRISKHERYYDTSGKLYIMTNAIKRLRDE